MIEINSKNYSLEEITYLHPREKIKFYCAFCGKEQIQNSSSVRSRWGDILLCKGCNVSNSKKQSPNNMYENQQILSIEELKNIKVKSRKILVKFLCKKCQQIVAEKAGVLRNRKDLYCERCSRKIRNIKRYGVEEYLELAYIEGVNKTHTELGNYERRLGIIRKLWVHNIEERLDSLEKRGWIVLDIDFCLGTILVQSRCCGTKILAKMGTASEKTIQCNCKKTGYSSKIETRFFKIVKKRFSEYKIVQGYRNWNKFRKNNNKGNFEIDVFIKEVSLGIEFNGSYWHDKNNQERELAKISLARENGIVLINIWEDDWKRDPEKCIEYIIYKIGEINERKNPQKRI